MLDNLTPTCSPSGLDWRRPLGESGAAVSFRFREIRLERTGWHAFVAIFLNQTLLESDTFNIRRREDRVRLTKQAHAAMGEVAGAAYPLEVFQHDFQLACLQTPDLWEGQTIRIEEFSEDDVPKPVTFVLKPFILDGAGTILFAPPGSAKSYVLQTWAICVSRGIGTLWDCKERPVLYINLERSNGFLRNREAALRGALGWAGKTGVRYLDGRGLSLRTVERKAKAALEGLLSPVVFLDSISRAGAGSLNDDESANAVIDMLNGLCPTWAAIGHTTKGAMDQAGHVFGSIHWIAGCDIEVKLAAESVGGALGVSLSIVKANEVGKFPAEYLKLTFSGPETPVSRIERANGQEFGGLAALVETALPLGERIKRLVGGQAMTVGEIALAVNKGQDHVRNELNRGRRAGLFVPVVDADAPHGEQRWGLLARHSQGAEA